MSLCSVFLLSAVREIIGAGTFAGIQVFSPDYAVKMIASPPGAFFSLGILIAAFKSVMYIINKKKEKAGE